MAPSDKERGREDLGCDMGERNWNKNTKICLACKILSLRIVPNMELYCSPMLNILAFRIFDVRSFLVFVFGIWHT